MRRVLPLLCVALGLALGGCLPGLTVADGAKLRVVSRPAKGSAPRHFVRVRGTRDGGSLRVLLPYSLAFRALGESGLDFVPAPFEIRFEAGVFDPKRVAVSEGAKGCLALFEAGGPVVFWLCGRLEDGGYRAYTSEDEDGLFYPGAARVESRIAWDGSSAFSYETRANAQAPWDVVASIPYETPMALDFSLLFDVSSLAKRAVFDVGAVSWSDVTPDQGLWQPLQHGLRHELDALASLEAAPPDAAAAGARLADARAELAEVPLAEGFLVRGDDRLFPLAAEADRLLGRASAALERGKLPRARQHLVRALGLHAEMLRIHYLCMPAVEGEDCLDLTGLVGGFDPAP